MMTMKMMMTRRKAKVGLGTAGDLGFMMMEPWNLLANLGINSEPLD